MPFMKKGKTAGPVTLKRGKLSEDRLGKEIDPEFSDGQALLLS
jgi:hypothetical protein